MSQPVTDFDYYSEELLEQPFEFYKVLRSKHPVYQVPDTSVFVVSRFRDVKRMCRDTENFSNNFSKILVGRSPGPKAQEILSKGWPARSRLHSEDPPRHRYTRGLFAQAFRPQSLEKVAPLVEQVTHELLDQVASKGYMKFVHDFADQLPLRIISHLLGVPESDTELIKTWSDAFASQLSAVRSEEQEIDNAHRIVEFQKYFASLLERRRQDPQDDLVSILATAKENGQYLELPDMLSICQQLMTAGNETTASALAGGMLLLIDNPDQLERLTSDPSLIPNAVEEILRLETPTSGLWRMVENTVDVHGVTIPAGSTLILRFAAANRDEQQFGPTAEEFDVTRSNAATHLAFGHGIHFCLGAELARIEMITAFKIILQRLYGFRLTLDKESRKHRYNEILRGLIALHIDFDVKQ